MAKKHYNLVDQKFCDSVKLLKSSGISIKRIAEVLGVHYSTVFFIVKADCDLMAYKSLLSVRTQKSRVIPVKAELSTPVEDIKTLESRATESVILGNINENLVEIKDLLTAIKMYSQPSTVVQHKPGFFGRR